MGDYGISKMYNHKCQRMRFYCQNHFWALKRRDIFALFFTAISQYFLPAPGYFGMKKVGVGYCPPATPYSDAPALRPICYNTPYLPVYRSKPHMKRMLTCYRRKLRHWGPEGARPCMPTQLGTSYMLRKFTNSWNITCYLNNHYF